MANQDFGLNGLVKVRPAEEADAGHLQSYCFPEQTKTQVKDELKADLEAEHTQRLVAETSGYPIGQITVSKNGNDPEVAQVSKLTVSGPFRQLGVADHLMKAAEVAAADDGAKTLEIEVPASETNVIQRYRDWGFVEKPLVILQKPLAEEAAAESAEEEEETPSSETSGEQQDLLGT